ncbi:MAG TPA: PIN domain-containing protein [Armatimonadota bacterium]|nr:PIN domain-containing protein [Armatimonadota bacterium]
MKGLRVLGLIFSGIFAFGCGLISYAVIPNPYLKNWRLLQYTGQPFHGYSTTVAIGFAIIGVLVGFLIGSTIYRRIVGIGQSLRRIPSEDKVAAVLGTVAAFVPASFIGIIIWQIPHAVVLVKFALILLISVLIIWLGNIIALSMKEEMKFFLPGMANSARNAPADGPVGATAKILDTNVIIDGRICDVCRSGFIEGTLILPGFVLEELQHIADSADSLRRNRGRRGLDILYQMQKELDSRVHVMDRYKVNFAPGDAVDMKLVKLAKSIGNADLVTNDYNLNKVAKLHGVRVLNVNELANALKPIVLPGEEMAITIVREGKEYNQGVGYLDDGTMVVVENGKRFMGVTINVAVSSVLQTVAGKMIFADFISEVQEAGKRVQR